MSKKRRMRKIAKDIAGQPKHKKMIAEWLASQNMKKIQGEALKKILIEGHRGYLAMSENSLTKLFDQQYDAACNELKKAEAAGVNSDGQRFGYISMEDRISNAKRVVGSAEEIYDEIFEKVFL